MNPLTLFLALGLEAAIVFAALMAFARPRFKALRTRIKERDATLAKLIDRREDVADAQHERLEIAAATEETLRAQVSTQAALVSELEHRCRSLDTKLRNTQQHIGYVCKERDFWVEWYHKQAAEHGAAQHLFLQELEFHVKRGSTHPINPVLRAMVQDFAETHPAAADAARPAPATPPTE